MFDLSQDTRGAAISEAVVSELKRRDILPDSNSIGMKDSAITQHLEQHLINVDHLPNNTQETTNQDVGKSLKSLTSSINEMRTAMDKQPVSEALIDEVVKAGRESVIGKSQDTRLSHNELEDRLGFKIPLPHTGMGTGRFQ